MAFASRQARGRRWRNRWRRARVVGDRKLLADAAVNGPDGEEAMQSPSFQIGTVVRLRSGGPAMVVVSVRGESTSCEWFDQGQKGRGEFPTSALECDE